MKVYRYENKYDGGGPWFSREGTSRNIPDVFGYTEIELSACISLQKLKEYFERELPEIFKNPDYQIVEYIFILIIVFEESCTHWCRSSTGTTCSGCNNNYIFNT